MTGFDVLLIGICLFIAFIALPYVVGRYEQALRAEMIHNATEWRREFDIAPPEWPVVDRQGWLR